MQYNKLYQYKNVSKQSAVEYSGELAIRLISNLNYNIDGIVTSTEDAVQTTDQIVLQDTLSNQED